MMTVGRQKGPTREVARTRTEKAKFKGKKRGRHLGARQKRKAPNFEDMARNIRKDPGSKAKGGRHMGMGIAGPDGAGDSVKKGRISLKLRAARDRNFPDLIEKQIRISHHQGSEKETATPRLSTK